MKAFGLFQRLLPRIICNGHCDVYMLLSKENLQLNVP